MNAIRIVALGVIPAATVTRTSAQAAPASQKLRNVPDGLAGQYTLMPLHLK